MGLIDELNAALKEGRKAFAAATDADALERIRVKYIGRSGLVKALMARLKEVPKEAKAEAGKLANKMKAELTASFKEAQTRLAAAAGASPAEGGALPDPTLPGITGLRGTRHPLTQTRQRLENIFERMGFSIADGPEIEDDFHNFTALNIPEDHPARDDAETFELSNGRLLRSATSSVQIRVMEKTSPPLRIIAPGRVYRPDAVDASHFYSFHQIEGLAVDERITFADLKGVLSLFAKEFFGGETATRFRPHFFPFTEPSAEMDVSCIFCKGRGCRVCKQSGWVEILGCGMVDPNVFEAVGYDAEKYTGFAFGMGVERIAMLSLGINDIRYFYDNDLRFLRQF